MGMEFSLIRVGSGEAYDLGKPAMRPPADDWETGIAGLDPMRDFLRWQGVMFPSERAMWRIGTDGENCEVVVLSERWTAETLAPVVGTALLQTDDADTAAALARAILGWAGDDRVVLVSDEVDLDRVSERSGIPIAEPRIVRTVWDDLAAIEAARSAT